MSDSDSDMETLSSALQQFEEVANRRRRAQLGDTICLTPTVRTLETIVNTLGQQRAPHQLDSLEATVATSCDATEQFFRVIAKALKKDAELHAIVRQDVLGCDSSAVTVVDAKLLEAVARTYARTIRLHSVYHARSIDYAGARSAGATIHVVFDGGRYYGCVRKPTKTLSPAAKTAVKHSEERRKQALQQVKAFLHDSSTRLRRAYSDSAKARVGKPQGEMRTRVDGVVGKTVAEALRCTFTKKGVARRYGRADLVYDLKVGYLGFETLRDGVWQAVQPVKQADGRCKPRARCGTQEADGDVAAALSPTPYPVVLEMV